MLVEEQRHVLAPGRSEAAVGRRNQLLPACGNEPLLAPVRRRRTTYFQYAAWTTISQTLWRLGPGRHAALLAPRPRIDPLRLGPCHALRSKASSMRPRSSSIRGSVFGAIPNLRRAIYSHPMRRTKSVASVRPFSREPAVLERPVRDLVRRPLRLIRGLVAILVSGLPAPAGPHDLLPAPHEATWQKGRLVLGPRFNVAFQGRSDPRIEAALRRTLERLQRDFGLRPAPASKDPARATLTVECPGSGGKVQSVGEDESYALTVTPRHARLAAGNPLGILRGLETLLQLVARDGHHVVLPAVAIRDAPRFPWRGLLLDPARHFLPVEVLKRTLDGMAAVKLNVLHWHLSDDQGFRVESRTFPRLHEGGGGGLYYTQDQVRAVLAYARERGIRVVPEFDVPGHATSWLVGYPQLGSAPGPYALVRSWGIFDNCLDPTRDEVYVFLDAFFSEMAALFPDAHLHVGGDEVTPRQWNADARIQGFLYEHSLRDAHDLQAFFNRRLEAILTSRGKRLVGWDEVLDPALPKGIVVQSWRGPAGLAEAARKGYDVVVSHGYYLDHMLPASAHYAVDPLPPETDLTPEQKAHVIGGEACMWGEYVTPETLDGRVWPRAAAIAERLWSRADVRDTEDMYRRLARQSERLEALGLTHRSSYPAMLQRLAGDRPIGPLQVLADVVEPVKVYTRGRLRASTSDTPLDRLVDAVRPESDAAREFANAVDRLLGAPSGAMDPARHASAVRDAGAVRSALTAWKASHGALDPILAASPQAADARSLSRDLSALGELGLQALEFLGSHARPPTAWREEALRLLKAAQAPRAELEIAVIPALRKLVLAAGQAGKAEGPSGEGVR